jgi:hypothetical protein
MRRSKRGTTTVTGSNDGEAQPGMTENTVHHVSVIHRSRAGLRPEAHSSQDRDQSGLETSGGVGQRSIRPANDHRTLT